MDWEGIKYIAFGALNLSHDELGKLTHGEFLELWEGFQWRDRYQRSLYAIHATAIMSGQSKKPLKPFQVFQLEKASNKKKTTSEESKRVVESLIKDLGGDLNGRNYGINDGQNWC